MKRILTALYCCALTSFLLANAAAAQMNPDNPDTVIDGDQELLDKLGLSYGPFPFMHSNSEEVAFDMLIDREVVWLQTPHFRIGSTLKKWKIPVSEKKAYRAELALMQEQYPDLDPKTSTLDPWLRLHLYAWRMEKMYAEFLAHTGFTQADFEMLPGEEVFTQAFAADFTETINSFELDRGGQKRAPGFPQWVGMGQYLGEPHRFEILMVEDDSTWLDFKTRYTGIKNDKPQRWNIKLDTVDEGITQARSRCMFFGISAKASKIRHEQHMHNALRHNMAINFMDAYMLYLFDLPAWLREGYAHYMRRSNNPGWNFFDSGEGAAPIESKEDNWKKATRSLIKKDEAIDFTRLTRLNDYVDIKLDDHFVVWSKIDFLIQTDVEKFGKFLLALKTQGTGAALADVQRDAFRDIYGWTMRQAEENWKAWALDAYAGK